MLASNTRAQSQSGGESARIRAVVERIIAEQTKASAEKDPAVVIRSLRSLVGDDDSDNDSITTTSTAQSRGRRETALAYTHDVGIMCDDGYNEDGDAVFSIATYVNTISPQACGVVRWTQRRNGILRLTQDEPYIKAVIGYYATAQDFGGNERVPYFSIISATVRRIIVWAESEGNLPDADSSMTRRMLCMIRLGGLDRRKLDLIMAGTLDAEGQAVQNITSLEVRRPNDLKAPPIVVRKFAEELRSMQSAGGAAIRSSGRSRSGCGSLPGVMFTPELFKTITAPKIAGLLPSQAQRTHARMAWGALRQMANDDWGDYQVVIQAFVQEYTPKLEACRMNSTPELLS